MAVKRTLSNPTEIPPEHRRSEIIAILAAGLARLIRAGEPPGEKLSESPEICLELPRETRLSGPTG
jgi:hypothetical protein